MIYELAKPEDIQAVYNVVQHTIKTIYPKYYPMEVVDFFCGHHSEDALEKDIKNGYVSVLKIDGTIVATGCLWIITLQEFMSFRNTRKRDMAHLL